ncbi:MAG: hypothetical protein DMF82_22780 [Acidobacteria bacterium]|nr:MAG: hypothetical protein DMF82_22780 [Acidobacteriota bacterium]
MTGPPPTVRGDLSSSGLPQVLRPLVRAHKTGVLRCTRERIVKTVYISEGRLIFATSTDPDDRLGEMLMRKGLITYRALQESILSLQAGKRQGTLLVESGAIRSRDLVEGVADQVQDIVHGLIQWESGQYEFTEGPLPSKEVIVLRMSTGDLLLEGVRRVQRWSRIRGGVGGLDQKYALAPDSSAIVSALSLQKEELNLVASLDGVMTLEEICAASRQSDYLVCRALWGLWAAGLVDRVPQDAAAERKRSSASTGSTASCSSWWATSCASARPVSSRRPSPRRARSTPRSSRAWASTAGARSIRSRCAATSWAARSRAT